MCTRRTNCNNIIVCVIYILVFLARGIRWLVFVRTCGSFTSRDVVSAHPVPDCRDIMAVWTTTTVHRPVDLQDTCSSSYQIRRIIRSHRLVKFHPPFYAYNSPDTLGYNNTYVFLQVSTVTPKLPGSNIICRYYVLNSLIIVFGEVF